MTSVYTHHQWLIIGLIFFGIIAYIALVRWRDRKWIENRFRGQEILSMSFGVNYFGRLSEPGKPKRSSGFLLLLDDGLFYRSRTARVMLHIKGDTISRVYPGNELKGVDLHQSVMKIDFLNENSQKDCAAFKVPYPPQWINAIKTNLLLPGRSRQ